MSKNPDQNIFEGVEYSAKQVSGMPYEAFAKQHKGVLWPNHKDQEAKMQAMHAEATRINGENTKPAAKPDSTARGSK